MEYKSYTTTHPKSAEQQEKESKIAANVDTHHPRGKQLYVGGLTWVRIVLLLYRLICSSSSFLSHFLINLFIHSSKSFIVADVSSNT